MPLASPFCRPGIGCCRGYRHHYSKHHISAAVCISLERNLREEEIAAGGESISGSRWVGEIFVFFQKIKYERIETGDIDHIPVRASGSPTAVDEITNLGLPTTFSHFCDTKDGIDENE